VKDKKVNQVLSEGGYQWEGEWNKERVKEDKSGGCIFAFMYEDRLMKSTEIVLRRGEEG
jgi:hypothetical protein